MKQSLVKSIESQGKKAILRQVEKSLKGNGLGSCGSGCTCQNADSQIRDLFQRERQPFLGK